MAEWKWGQDADDWDGEQENEEGFNKWNLGNRDGVIFLIDCSKAMFEVDILENPFEKSIKCAKSMIQNKIISSERDLLGIVFYGTEKEKNGTQSKHIYVEHDLEQPGAESVLNLELFLTKSDNNNFSSKYGHSLDYSISDALWTCSDMFAKCSQKIAFKRILLFTNNDNPHRNDAGLKRAAATKVEDLHNNGINLELFHMNKPGKTFDYEAFYKDTLITDMDNSRLPDPADKLEELLTRLRCKDHKKRALTRIPLSLGEGMEFSVELFTLVRSCAVPYGVKLYKKNHEEVKSVTKTFLEDTGEVLMPQDQMKCLEYASKNILLEQQEVDEIKHFDTAGIKLMGFKPKKSLKKYYHVKPAQFIYPDESMIGGSSIAFTALLKKCLEKDVVAICRCIPRKNALPRIAALVPQVEELDGHGNQTSPPGFSVIFMPYADDFRKVPLNKDLPRANRSQIDKAMEVVKKLQFKFHSVNFENPKIQRHYANVEAMALDRDNVEQVEDHTVPNDEMMQKRAGKLISEFKDLVFPHGYDPNATGKKRTAGGKETSGVQKKPKIESSEIDAQAEAKAGTLNKLNVAVLKDIIKKLKIRPDSYKKADLIDAISEHFGY